jgi:hypothetical protein
MPRGGSEEVTTMPYNATLAERIRAILGDEPDLVEQKMFGGLSFMLAGNLCVGILGDDLVVRVPKEEAEATSTLPHVRPMDFTGRPMRGFLYVDPEGLATARALRSWVGRTVAFAESQPVKPLKPAKRVTRQATAASGPAARPTATGRAHSTPARRPRR